MKHGPLINAISNSSKDSINSVSENFYTSLGKTGEEAKITSVEAMILQHQLRCTGHVVRMPGYRLPKQLLYSEFENGKWWSTEEV